MSKIENIPRPIIEMLCTYKAFRKLGFQAKEIHPVDGPLGNVGIELAAQGQKFIVDCGIMLIPSKQVKRLWIQTVKDVNRGVYSREDLDRVWRKSVVYTEEEAFVNALLAKGFSIPLGWN